MADHIFIENKTQYDLQIDSKKIKSWLINCVDPEYKLLGIHYYFVTDEELRAINRDFLNHDYYTDIISFDYCRGKRIKGECWISVDRVTENSNSLKIRFRDELLRVMVHGLLHFVGFRDKTDKEKAIMREEENKCLAKL